ncbi:MFS transporter [Hoeflea sp. G2-23]|uniref:MFS transporter n=1 Tax=Hoeflea algicola TaxID=2983763 RepID=A0ABT3ZB73_9HYPH|nr:MFS transporter [Hoeflea algicola]MCY0148893.1 MFS transporter [Hoeflea algicola]
MIEVLRHPVYARLFSAQVIALVGTGLLTVALGLLAFDLAGDRAGAVLGTVFAIKMIAYVGLAPIASALVERWPRKRVLIGADLLRAGVALMLPFVDQTWQIYVLIFVLQAASATFTPAFQATIPDILEDERDYTRALSLSRLAYDLENLLSPALAGLLLLVMGYHWLFSGTVLGFVGSALLVYSAVIPQAGAQQISRPFVDRLTRGVRIYLATPRLRGLLALNLTAASAGAFVLVNTVVMVRSGYGAGDTEVAIALAAFGAGSMLSALVLPRLLESVADRSVMMAAGVLLALLTLSHAAYLLSDGLLGWVGFLLAWGLSGVFYSAILTPSGRLLRISAHAEDRPALFTAQFTLSHACWLLAYPVAGWVGLRFGLPVAMALLGLMALAGVLMARAVWPADDHAVLEHEHADLAPDHPHLRAHPAAGARHRHAFVIDDEHRVWPTHG